MDMQPKVQVDMIPKNNKLNNGFKKNIWTS